MTVVTPSFNQGRFLEETLRSVIDQREEIHEYFVMDGGSQDGSREIIEKFGKSIDFWVSASDGGQAAAIRSGFARATGDILYWINSDDVLLPGAIAAARNAFLESGASVITGWDVMIDAESRIIRVRQPPAQTCTGALWGVLHVSQPTCFFKRELYERVGGLDPRWHGVLDTELWLRMLRVSQEWGHLRRCVAAFRVHEAQKGLATRAKILEEHKSLDREYPEFAGATFGARAGVLAYRVREMVRGRYAREVMLSRTLRGRRLSELPKSLLGGNNTSVEAVDARSR